MLDAELHTTFWSGTAGDIIYSRNQHKRYTRPYVIPNQPDTVKQVLARNRFRTVNLRWRDTLTDQQRLDWAAYAAAVDVSASGDRCFRLTGKMRYVGTNMLRSLAGKAFRDAVPETLARTVLTPPTFDSWPYPRVNLQVNPLDQWRTQTGGFLLIFKATQKPSTINFHATPYVWLTVANGFDFPFSPIVQISGIAPVDVGNRLFLKFVAQTKDGRTSEHVIVFGQRP